MKALNAWKQSLYQSLPPAFAAALLPWVNRLWEAVGKTATQKQQQGSPEGYDGLNHKGNYEQLVVSEWALARLHPSEFLRRATMGEQLYLQPRYESPQHSKTTYLVIDHGVFQLGYPRLVQLALLFVFLRQARAAKATLAYGFWQDEHCNLINLSDETSLSQFLANTSPHEVSQNNTERWQRLLQKHNIGEDIWWIGSPAVIKQISEKDSPNYQPNRIAIDPLIQHNWIRLHVSTKQHQQALELPLLANNLAIQLLRNPWATVEIKRNEGLPVNPKRLLFSRNGKKIVIQGENNQALKILSIPNSQKAKSGRVKSWALPEGADLVGIDITKKSIRAMYRHNNRWCFYNTNTADFDDFDAIQHIETSTQQTIPAIYFLADDTGNKAAYLVDAKKKLRKVALTEDNMRIHTLASEVLCFGHTMNCGYAAVWNKTKSVIDFRWFFETNSPSSREFQVNKNQPTFLAHGSGIWYKGQPGCIAYCIDQEQWRILGCLDFSSKIDCHINHRKDQVIGVAVINHEQVGLICLYQQRLWLATRKGVEDRIRLDKPPLLCWMNPIHPQVITWDGDELQVHDLRKNETIWRLHKHSEQQTQQSGKESQ